MNFFEAKPYLKIKLYCLLKSAKKDKYTPFLEKLQSDIEKMVEKDPQHLLFIIGSNQFNYVSYLDEHIILKAIAQFQSQIINETLFCKLTLLSLQTKEILKVWIAFFNDQKISSNYQKFYKFFDQFFFLEDFNNYQIQFFFYLFNSAKKEVVNFYKVLRLIFYKNGFLETLINNEVFHTPFFNIMFEIADKKDPFTFYAIYMIFLKLENYGLKSMELYVTLKKIFEIFLKFSLTDQTKSSILTKAGLVYFLMKNGFYSLPALSYICEYHLGNFFFLDNK